MNDDSDDDSGGVNVDDTASINLDEGERVLV
jgi:hypothetical protein